MMLDYHMQWFPSLGFFRKKIDRSVTSIVILFIFFSWAGVSVNKLGRICVKSCNTKNLENLHIYGLLLKDHFFFKQVGAELCQAQLKLVSSLFS